MPTARKSDMEFMTYKQNNGNIQITLNIDSSICFINEKKNESFCELQIQEFTRLFNCHVVNSQTAESSSYVREQDSWELKPRVELTAVLLTRAVDDVHHHRQRGN